MDERSKRKHKKNKEEKKGKRRKHKHSSSESEDEWVEKGAEEKQLSSEPVNKNPFKCDKEENDKRDGWMSMEMDFSQFGAKKESTKEPEVKQTPADEPGQHSRELNPYWRDGGTGLPPEKKNTTDSRNDRTYSDKSERRHRSRSKEREYRRSDKYDSSSDRNRSERNRDKYYTNDRQNGRRNRDDDSRSNRYKDDNFRSNRSKGESARTFRKPDDDEYNSYRDERDRRYDKRPEEGRESTSSSSSSRKGWKKSQNSEETSSDSKLSKHKPDDDDYNSYRDERDRRYDKRPDEGRESTSSSSSSRKGWKKSQNSEETGSDSKSSTHKTENQDRGDFEISSGYEMDIVESPQKILTTNELNFLCAKLIKAELKGNKKLARELEKEVENARKLRLKYTEGVADDEEVKNREVIILTETDSKGFSRPLKSVREEMVKSKKKVPTHEGKERVRYFADDDSLTLSEMFEKERFGSSRDQNATFMNLMGKEMSEKNEDAFEETASFDNVNRKEKKDWDNAVRHYSQREKAIDSCSWCLDSKNANQDVIVAIRNSVHLCVPSSQSLTEGHCIIVPSDHISCATLLDEDVWEDIMSLRKNLVKIFEAEDEDIVFFECATNLEKYPHMLLHCVPIPKEMGDVAPIYFKKAIMECEMEWSNNKKVVDLAGRNVRKAIPKGLPYFAVDFGMQSGYAHVIEDKRLFPKNFAQEIIGGMLDIDHSKWRKLHKDSQESIQKKVEYMKELIKKNL